MYTAHTTETRKTELSTSPMSQQYKDDAKDIMREEEMISIKMNPVMTEDGEAGSPAQPSGTSSPYLQICGAASASLTTCLGHYPRANADCRDDSRRAILRFLIIRSRKWGRFSALRSFIHKYKRSSSGHDPVQRIVDSGWEVSGSLAREKGTAPVPLSCLQSIRCTAIVDGPPTRGRVLRHWFSCTVDEFRLITAGCFHLHYVAVAMRDMGIVSWSEHEWHVPFVLEMDEQISMLMCDAGTTGPRQET